MKKTLIAARVHYFLQPVQDLFTKMASLSDFVRWCHDHPTSDLGHGIGARFNLYRHIIDTLSITNCPFTYIEFGVYEGESIRWWVENAKNPLTRFIGFDTFKGLPEAWAGMRAGSFSTEGKLPDISDPRCRFIAGLFQDVVATSLVEVITGGRLVIHFDADLYSSTLFALSAVHSFLKTGDVLLFDEFSSVTQEFRAFRDFQQSFRFAYDVIGTANNYTMVALRVKESELS